MKLIKGILIVCLISLSVSQENALWNSESCPRDCKCSLTERIINGKSEKWTKTTECDAGAYKTLSETIPKETQALLLEGNSLSHFDNLLGHIENLSCLEEIVLSGNKFTDFESNRTFVTVASVDASSNQLTKLSTEDFASFPNLNHLSLQHNSITHIDKNLCLNKTANLRSLIISYNQIDNLEWIQNCSALAAIHLLDLSGNKQHDEVLRNFSFAGLSALKTLRLEEMDLHDIEKYAFYGLVKIQDLDLENNFLATISTEALATLKNLRSLNLNGNKVKQIRPKDLSNFPKLEFIELTGLPSLQIIDKSAFENLPNLKTILLFDNPQLSYIDSNAFKNCPSMETLDAHNTLIETIMKTTIDSLPSLRVIDLRQNEINCNCMMMWAKDWATSVQDIQFPGQNTRRNMVCARPASYRSSQISEIRFKSNEPCLPEVQPTFPNYLKTDQNKVILECRAFGEPTPNITWVLPNGKYLSTNESISTLNQQATVDTRGTLILDGIEPGEYRCVAENGNGRTERPIVVEIQDPIMHEIKASAELSDETTTAAAPFTEENPSHATTKPILQHKLVTSSLSTVTSYIVKTTQTEDMSLITTNAQTHELVNQEVADEENHQEDSYGPFKGLQIQVQQVTGSSALITWSGIDLDKLFADYQNEMMTLTLHHNGRIIYKKILKPFWFLPNMEVQATEFNITFLNPGSKYKVCLTIHCCGVKDEKDCETIYTKPYTKVSSNATTLSVVIFLTLSGITVVISGLVYCGKKCQNTQTDFADYEKVEDDSQFDKTSEPLIYQTSKNRKQEEVIKTSTTTSFI